MARDRPKPHRRPDDPPADPGLAWLRDAMRLVWHQLDDAGGEPLVLTVVAVNGGRLVSLTASVRAPGRIYAKPIDPEEHRPR